MLLKPTTVVAVLLQLCRGESALRIRGMMWMMTFDDLDDFGRWSWLFMILFQGCCFAWTYRKYDCVSADI